jgi:hypothetical protein
MASAKGNANVTVNKIPARLRFRHNTENRVLFPGFDPLLHCRLSCDRLYLQPVSTTCERMDARTTAAGNCFRFLWATDMRELYFDGTESAVKPAGRATFVLNRG